MIPMIPIDMTAEFSSMLIGMNVLLLIAGAAIAVSAWVSHHASFLSHGAFVLEVRAEADARLAVLNAVIPKPSRLNAATSTNMRTVLGRSCGE